MSKVLLVSWTIFPQTTGSTVLVNNLATQFTKDTMVIAGEVVQGKSNFNWPQFLPKIYYLNPFITLSKKGSKYTKWLNINKIISQLEKIAIQENCTSIFCIFPDEFYLYAAYKASKRLNLPFYTWFHNTYQDNRNGILLILAKWLQPKIFHYAQQNFVMSDGMLEYYKKKYPDISFETLEHPFNIPNIKFTPSDQKCPIKFAYTGSLNDSCLDASLRLFQVIKENPDYELHIFSLNSESILLKYGIKGPNIKYHGFVPDEKFLPTLMECDIMLLPHGFEGNRSDVEYKTIFPTRTIPLLYSNKPILAHSPPDCFLTSFLKRHDCAVIVDSKSKIDILKGINTLLDSKERREQLVKNAIEASAQFDAKKIAAQLNRSLK